MTFSIFDANKVSTKANDRLMKELSAFGLVYVLGARFLQPIILYGQTVCRVVVQRQSA